MGTITVAQLRSDALPADCALVAGTGGLQREVSWPATLRTRPPAFASLKGGEILLISTESLKLLDSSLSIARLLQSVRRFNIAAAAVAGDIPSDAISLAEAAEIPLFQLPVGTPLAEIEQSISRAIVDWQSELQRQGQEIYRHLTELALEGHGVTAIAAVLASTVGRLVIHEDRSFAVTLHGQTSDGLPARGEIESALRAGQNDLRDWLRNRRLSPSDPPVTELALDSGGFARLVSPIVLREGVVGYLSLIGVPDGFREIDKLALVRAAAACAIDVVRESAALDAEERAGATFLDDLLSGKTVTPIAIKRIATRLGLDLGQPHLVVAIRQYVLPRRGYRELAPASAQPEPVSGAALAAIVEKEFGRRHLRAHCRGWENTAVAVFPSPRTESLRPDIQTLSTGIASRLGTPVSMGVSQARTGPDGIPDSFREAMGAVTLGSRLFGPGRTTFYGDLGLYRLILTMSDSPDLRAFHDETLGKLFAADRKSGGELARTLEAYFASRCSPTEAAERLHVHRNTLLYRLRRIEAITGLDLEDPETRLSLNLALHVGQVIDRV